MKIFVARHGQTEWNAQNKVCGRTDTALTEEGRAQAAKLAAALEGRDLQVILASPLRRAVETAEIVSRRCGVPVELDGRLIEQNYGIYEGVDRKDNGFLNNKRHFAYRYPGGESMMQVAHRVYSMLDELRERYAGKNTLLVCHGGVCRVIRTYFQDMTNEEYFHYSPDNATYQEYELL